MLTLNKIKASAHFPLLQNAMLLPDGRIYRTDYDRTIIVQTDYQPTEPTLVDWQRLSKALGASKKLSFDPVSNSFSVAGVQIDQPTDNPEDYPSIPDYVEPNQALDLKALKLVLLAANTDQILLHLNQAKVIEGHLTATDRYRLFRAPVSLPDGWSIPLDVAKWIPANKNVTAAPGVISWDDVTVVFNAQEGTYPNVHNLWPTTEGEPFDLQEPEHYKVHKALGQNAPVTDDLGLNPAYVLDVLQTKPTQAWQVKNMLHTKNEEGVETLTMMAKAW